jgi:hypothetical protein
MCTSPVRTSCADRDAYDYSDYHSASRVCASIPASAVPDVLGCARGGRDRFLDCTKLATATQGILTLLGVAARAAPICRPRLSSKEAQALIEPAPEAV